MSALQLMSVLISMAEEARRRCAWSRLAELMHEINDLNDALEGA